MIILDGVSCYPRYALKVKRTELDKVSTRVGEKGEFWPKSGTHLQKILGNKLLPAKKMF